MRRKAPGQQAERKEDDQKQQSMHFGLDAGERYHAQQKLWCLRIYLPDSILARFPGCVAGSRRQVHQHSETLTVHLFMQTLLDNEDAPTKIRGLDRIRCHQGDVSSEDI